ncbi:MAG: thermonuclease family protein [Candidatus Izemoplasmataceae bacterium]
MKKFLLIGLVFLALFTLTACNNDPEEQDPDETPTLNTDYTDELTLDVNYEGSSFISDGIGEVELVQCVDGDTARFRDGNETFAVRFLGIDTPESTYRFDPWGKAASDFTCSKLENAETIVLEADSSTNRTDDNNRYLAFVWYDGRLLNLELIEQAYSTAQGVLSLKYGSTMMDAFYYAQSTNLRIYGETDPDFDYSKEGVQITIEELITNTSAYVGRKITLTGTITRVLGNGAWIQQGDYGVYLYLAFEFTTRIVAGNEVIIDNLTPTYYPDQETGTLQVTDFRSRNTEVLSTDNEIEPVTVLIDEITEYQIGSFIELLEVTIVSRFGNQESFTLTVEDSEGNEFQLRKDEFASDEIDYSLLQVGTKIDVKGPVHTYNGRLQLMLVQPGDVEIHLINE